jgi:hypothetical protein
MKTVHLYYFLLYACERGTFLAFASMLLYINSSTTLGRSDKTMLERKELCTLFGKRFMFCIGLFWYRTSLDQPTVIKSETYLSKIGNIGVFSQESKD